MTAVAISDYVPASETANWVDTSENTVGNKIVAMPIYLIGVPLVWNKTLFKQAGLDPDKAPATWSDFLADCAALKAHGITPLRHGQQRRLLRRLDVRDLRSAGAQLARRPEVRDRRYERAVTPLAGLDTLLGKMYGMMQDIMAKGYLNYGRGVP